MDVPLNSPTPAEAGLFVVRRTIGGYIELIETKTPRGGSLLFRLDRPLDSYYTGAELSKVAARIRSPFELLDADRHRITTTDGEDTNKVRAKVVIGRDGNQKRAGACRRYVGHPHRTEVVFDQLPRVARRVVGYLETPAKAVARQP